MPKKPIAPAAGPTPEPAQFRVSPGRKLNLIRYPTSVPPFYQSEKNSKELLAQCAREIGDLQRILYASNTWSILMIFQALDAAGKDGAISHVLSGVNQQGCEVHSFQHPSAEELDHDFLWRTTCRLPARGRIGVFNRSYYEEVLIVRVHPEIRHAERIPNEPADITALWKQRYRSILDFEKHLHRNGTLVLKFFLHISKEEQRKRLLQRVDETAKNWKVNRADIEERKYWDEYMVAYEDCLRATSTKNAPWYIIPADDKLNARLIISRAVIEAMRGLPLAYPQPDAARRAELAAIRSELVK